MIPPALVMPLIVGASAAAIGVAGGWTLRGWHAGRAAAEVKAERAQESAQRSEVAQAATAANLDESSRRILAYDKVASYGQAKIDTIPARVRAAAVAGDGLRVATAQAAASCGAASPDSAASAPSAGHPGRETAGGLLAELSRRLEEEGRRVAAVAEERAERIAACEQAHDALRKP